MKRRRWFDFLFYVSVAAGMPLGTSSFMMMSKSFAVAGAPAVIGGTVLAGLVCALVAAAVGEMASMFPTAPGLRTYLRAGIGDVPSLTLVYLYLGVIVLAGGAEAYVFARVVAALWPAVSPSLVVLALVLGTVAANVAGVRPSRVVQVGTTAALLAGVIALGIAGFALPPAPAVQTGGSLGEVFAIGGLSVFLYVGFEWVTPLGADAAAYRRSIPFSMLVALLLNAVAYALFQWALGRAFAREAIAAAVVPHVAFAGALLSRTGALAAGALSLVATVSTFNAGVMGGSRLIVALARERHLPAWCGSLWLLTGAPVGALTLLAVAALAGALSMVRWHWHMLAGVVASAVICLNYAAMLVSAVRLRRKAPDRARAFRMPFGPALGGVLVALFSILGALALGEAPSGRWVGPACFGGMLAVCLGLARRSVHRSASKGRIRAGEAIEVPFPVPLGQGGK